MSDVQLFRNAFRDMLRPKRLLAALVLIAMPTTIAFLWRSFGRRYDADIVYNTLSGLLIFGFLLVILAVIFGTGVVAQEIEQKTISYLLTRPVPRWRILSAKFAAALLAITLTAWIATLCLAAVAYGFGGGRERAGRLTTADLYDVLSLAEKLRNPNDLVSKYVQTQLTTAGPMLNPPERGGGVLEMMGVPTKKKEPATAEELAMPLVEDLNNLILADKPLYDKDLFANIHLSESTRQLAEQNLTGKALSRLNRELLAAAYPNEIAPGLTVVGQIKRDFLILFLGAFAYGSLFLLLATLLNRPLLWGLLFAFGWESWVPNFPGSFQKVSLMSYLRVLSPHPQPEATGSRGVKFFSILNPDTIPMSLAWFVLTVCCAAFLLLALAIFSTREYVPRDDAE